MIRSYSVPSMDPLEPLRPFLSTWEFRRFIVFSKRESIKTFRGRYFRWDVNAMQKGPAEDDLTIHVDLEMELFEYLREAQLAFEFTIESSHVDLGNHAAR